MDCTGCLWLHTEGATKYCLKRDGCKPDDDELKFPTSPNWGCDEKTIVISNAAGEKIALCGAEQFIKLPNGYE